MLWVAILNKVVQAHIFVIVIGVKIFSLVCAISGKNVNLYTNYSYMMINKSTIKIGEYFKTISLIHVAKSLTP